MVVEGPGGYSLARDREGKPFDILDVSDQLAEKYGRLYLVDLDGRERDQPQLDYLQEISRNAEVWVDSGVRTSDQAIDVVVAGAFRTVLSTAQLRAEGELDQAWKLSPEIAFEVAMGPAGVVAASPEYAGRSPASLVQTARAVGVRDVIYSPRGTRVDWSLAHLLAEGGPLWIDGSFGYDELEQLRNSGAIGGIFSIEEELGGTAIGRSTSAGGPLA